jgi:hypothetical protein
MVGVTHLARLGRWTVIAFSLSCTGPERTSTAGPGPDLAPAADPSPDPDRKGTARPRDWPPSSRDALAALLHHRSVRPSDPSCHGVTGDPRDVTLGDYLAHLLAQQVEAHAESLPSSLRVTCDLSGSTALARCRLMVRVQAEDPWEYGVEFELDRDGAIPERTLRCPGTG